MKTNNLIYNTTLTAENGYIFKISIMLNDFAITGNENFSITGEAYKANTKKFVYRNLLFGGNIGATIAHEFPQFKIFNELHLRDFKGAPMYAIDKSFYLLKRVCISKFMESYERGIFLRYYDCSLNDYLELSKADTVEEFSKITQALNLPEKWQEKANKAIKELEELTGLKFESKATKNYFIPTT